MNGKLEQAVRLLEEEQVSCVIYRSAEDVRLSDAIGIKPLMVELRQDRSAFENCAVADKVIGKAAALMLILGKADAAYGKIMSESAWDVLSKSGIQCGYGELVPYIENRTRTGKCPMEETVQNTDDPEEAFGALEQTIARLMAQK